MSWIMVKKGQKQAFKFSDIKLTEKDNSDEGTFRFPKWPRNKQNIQNSHWPGGKGFVDKLLSDSYVDTINNNRLTCEIEFTVNSNFITSCLVGETLQPCEKRPDGVRWKFLSFFRVLNFHWWMKKPKKVLFPAVCSLSPLECWSLQWAQAKVFLNHPPEAPPLLDSN